MPTATLTLSSNFLKEVVQQTLLTKDFQLGIILDGTNVDDSLVITTPNSVIAVEYNAAGWVRPTATLSGTGIFNIITNQLILPDMQWSITAPTGGLAIKQQFIILGGITTPGDTSGIMIGSCTYANPLNIVAGQTELISFKGDVFGSI